MLLRYWNAHQRLTLLQSCITPACPSRFFSSSNDNENSVLLPKLNEHDPRFCAAITQARSQDGMFDSCTPRTVVLEGQRLILDAMRSGGRLRYLYASSRSLPELLPLDSIADRIFYMPLRILKHYSQMKTCPGLLAIFEVPSVEHRQTPPNCQAGLWNPLPVILILDNVRDPGNMGTLIRTAAGFGIPAVITSKGTVDVWNEKILRAGMSAHFRVPIYQGLDWSQIIDFIKQKNENMKVFVADSSSWKNGLEVPGARTCSPASVHFKVNYFPQHHIPGSEPRTDQSVALVLGSEAHGPSTEAYDLSKQSGGCRLLIPCDTLTESLSVSVAASIILGEMQRQYLSTYGDCK